MELHFPVYLWLINRTLAVLGLWLGLDIEGKIQDKSSIIFEMFA